MRGKPAKTVIFVTGTDTGIGKTTVVCHFIRTLNAQGYRTAGLKPLASGSEWIGGRLCNPDALLIQEAMGSLAWPYELINPIALEQPIAPHIAAAQIGMRLSVDKLLTVCLDAVQNPDIDVLFIEGVGGWFVPLNEKETMADFVMALQVPVLLVVGIRLGCLNHALLTNDAFKHHQVPCIGWVANELTEHAFINHENKRTLDRCLSKPCLGYFRFNRLM